MMYTITKGPSKLVTQRRTGPTQQIENKSNDLKLKTSPWITSNSPAPKIVFNRLNGKRYHTTPPPKEESCPDGFTPAHEENVRFVYEAWQEVEQKLGGGETKGAEPARRWETEGAEPACCRETEGAEPDCCPETEGAEPACCRETEGAEPACCRETEGAEPARRRGPVQYAENTPGPVLKNFVPVDLEEWWAQRFLANIANLS